MALRQRLQASRGAPGGGMQAVTTPTPQAPPPANGLAVPPGMGNVVETAPGSRVGLQVGGKAGTPLPIAGQEPSNLLTGDAAGEMMERLRGAGVLPNQMPEEIPGAAAQPYGDDMIARRIVPPAAAEPTDAMRAALPDTPAQPTPAGPRAVTGPGLQAPGARNALVEQLLNAQRARRAAKRQAAPATQGALRAYEVAGEEPAPAAPARPGGGGRGRGADLAAFGGPRRNAF